MFTDTHAVLAQLLIVLYYTHEIFNNLLIN